jgi:hypothetical protein
MAEPDEPLDIVLGLVKHALTLNGCPGSAAAALCCAGHHLAKAAGISVGHVSLLLAAAYSVSHPIDDAIAPLLGLKVSGNGHGR